MSTQQHIDELADALHAFRLDPVGYVYWAWDWEGDRELQVVDYSDRDGPSFEALQPYRERYGVNWGPDAWFLELLDGIGREVRGNAFDGKVAVAPIRRLVASGHGIGKSAGMGMLSGWIRDTRPFSRTTVTANTYPQLINKTWREILRWGRKSRTAFLWDFRAEEIHHRVHGKDWAQFAQTCAPENADSFQGQHSVQSTSAYLVDECSGIDARIWTAMEGGLSDGEPMILAFGNPTRTDSRMAKIMVNERHRWGVQQIDSRRAYITNKDQIREWLDAYGDDSDFARVRVKGELPRTSTFQLIPTEKVSQARKNAPVAYPEDPILMGVDVARHGPCETVIAFRRGLDARSIPWKYSRFTDDLTEIADEVALAFDDLAGVGDDWRPDAILIDATAMGWGVHDLLRKRNYPVHAVEAGKSIETTHAGAKVSNIGTACWLKMRDWLKRGAIPDDPVLALQLETRKYGFTDGGAQKLESKEKIIKDAQNEVMDGDSLSPSPDRADALATTWGVRIADRKIVKPPTELERMEAKQRRRSGLAGRSDADSPHRRYY
ncbi:MAG: hypothetical protein QNJ97_28675 [Myxococcota bacterium]|nr:hypothetical protein [Myxococcota bacterium]